MQNPFAGKGKLRSGLPVLSGAFPLLGHLGEIYKGLDRLQARARDEVGPVYFLQVATKFALVCTGQDALQIFKSEDFDSSHLSTISPLVAGESLLSRDGALHRHMRSAMNKPLLPRGLSAAAVGRDMAEVFARLIDQWCTRGVGKVLPDIQEASLEIVFRMLGAAPGDLPQWRKQYRRLLLANLGISARFPGSPATRAARAKDWIDARFDELIARTRAAGDRQTLLGAIVHSEDDDGQPLTDAELRDNLRLLVLGGHETISSTMAWMAIAVASDEALWASLKADGNGATVPTTPQEAKSFPFAEALFRETVRMHPPFGLITRQCIKPHVLHGREIPAGTLVAVDLWGIAHDESIFPAASTFDPSRWLRGTPPTPIELSQFGAGPHFCVGYHLAWLQGVSFAASLARAPKVPKLRGEMPRPIFLPTEHPPPDVRIAFA